MSPTRRSLWRRSGNGRRKTRSRRAGTRRSTPTRSGAETIPRRTPTRGTRRRAGRFSGHNDHSDRRTAVSPAEKRYKETTLHPERRRGAMLPLLALVALLPAGIPGEAGGRDEGGTPGVRVTMEVPFASESLDAVSAAIPARDTPFPGNRAITRKRIDRVPASGPFDASAASPLQSLALSAPGVTPQAPLLDSSF